MPKCEKVIFAKGEIKKTVPIVIVKDDKKNIDKPDGKTEGRLLDDGASEDEGSQDVYFKVKIEKPKPEGVKVSKRNCAIIAIVSGVEEEA